ncbi:MAG: TlpA family protein disulfide reductase [Burkholderiaceae bacterium]|nr:TlpA family protein disulfide reductase [Burkholderiaceae bacterium]
MSRRALPAPAPRRALRRRLLGGAALAPLAALGGAVGSVGLAAPAPATAGSGPSADAAGLLLEPPGQPGRELLERAALWDLDDRPVRWSALVGGRPVIVNFWARWCAPCRVEIPELVALHQRRTPVAVVGIALENDAAPLRDFLRAYEVDYPVVLARGGGLDLMRALGNTRAGLPFTVALGRSGQRVASRLGLLSRAQLEAAVQKVAS